MNLESRSGKLLADAVHPAEKPADMSDISTFQGAEEMDLELQLLECRNICQSRPMSFRGYRPRLPDNANRLRLLVTICNATRRLLCRVDNTAHRTKEKRVVFDPPFWFCAFRRF